MEMTSRFQPLTDEQFRQSVRDLQEEIEQASAYVEQARIESLPPALQRLALMHHHEAFYAEPSLIERQTSVLRKCSLRIS